MRATFERFEAAAQSGDGERACSLLSASARARAEQLPDGERGCAAALSALGATTAQFEQKPSEVLSVEVDGDEATASISDAGRPPVPVPFVREGGSWKLADLGLGDGS